MDEKPFRILLDFSEAGILGLRFVWMHISPRELNTIYDFKQAIVRKFSFTEDCFKLFLRDGLLLETEKIAILREDDIVKIQLEAPVATSMECSATNAGFNISVAQTSAPCLSSAYLSLNKSCKRNSDEIFTASSENGTNNLSSNRPKKKKKHDKSTVHLLDDLPNTSEEPSMNISQEDATDAGKVIKSSSSSNNKGNKQPVTTKKWLCNKTPTSEFINFAVKLSEAKGFNQIEGPSDVKVTESISHTNLYKTAEIISKTSLSPIPENTYELSNSKVLNLTESLEDCEISSVNDNGGDGNNIRSRRGRRKRKRKTISSDSCLSADVNTELEGSFLADVVSNETYNTSSDARKHILFRSPSPLKGSTTVTLDHNSSNFDEPSGSKNFKSYSESDSPKMKSLKGGSQLDVKCKKVSESAVSEIGDFTKESTPFSKKKSNLKSWGVTPLQRFSSSSTTFDMDTSGISKTDVFKPAYEDCTPLNCLPPLGTRLVYKTLELNEDYCPEVTDYKEGILRKVDPNTDELEIELVQEEIKPGRSGKFENVWENEDPPTNQVIKMVSLSWSALIDPRLLP